MVAVVASLSFGWPLPASAASSSTASDLQGVITSAGTISTLGGVFHGLRSTSTGAWNGFNSVSGGTGIVGMPSPVDQVAIAGNNGELLVLATSVRGSVANLYHALRAPDGSWRGFNNVSGPASVPASTSYPAVAAAIVNGDLHVLLVAIDGPLEFLYHAIRYASTGAWSGFNLMGNAPPNVISLAAAGINGDLHVLITLTHGGSVLHAIRYSSGYWNGFNDVAKGAFYPGSVGYLGGGRSGRPGSPRADQDER